MKKTVALILTAVMCLLGIGPACASVELTNNAYVGFVGETVSIQLTSRSQNGQSYRICDEQGNVLFEGRTKGGSTYPSASFMLSEDMPYGVTISLYVDDAAEPCDTALLACDRRPGAAITRVDRDDKKIAITFDTANAASKTLKILDLLDQYGVKATFFVMGLYVDANPDVTREIEARGHELAGHSYNHPHMPDLQCDAILKDFGKMTKRFENTVGHDVSLYRPPAGYSTKRDRAIARALGQEVIQWTLDSKDGFSDTSRGTVLSRLQKLGSGDIVLMHVYGTHTISVLEEMLPWFIEQGYELVTVSDLLLKGDTYIDADGVQHLRPSTEEAGAQ